MRVRVVTVTNPDRSEEHEYIGATIETTVDRTWETDGQTFEEHGLVVHTTDSGNVVYPYGTFSAFGAITRDVQPDPEPGPHRMVVTNANGQFGELLVALPAGYTVAPQIEAPAGAHELAVIAPDGTRETVTVRIPTGLVLSPVVEP